MALNLRELDDPTRDRMLAEFAAEQDHDDPFVPASLSPRGLVAWPALMAEAIRVGDDTTLRGVLLAQPDLLKEQEEHTRNGVTRLRSVNAGQASERLATSEFNTWYVRGLAGRLIDEGVRQVVVYRAAEPRWEVAGCSEHEGQTVSVQDVYEGHRRRYWPAPGDPTAFSIPFQAGCHHSIARLE